MLTITSEHPSSSDHFERKSQDKISPSDQSFEKYEEELIEFKEEHYDKLKNLSLGPIQNEVITINSENPSSEDHFESKFQDKISSYNQSFEQPEEELIEFKGEQNMDPHKLSSEHIENKMVPLTSENLSSEDCFEIKLQAKFDKSGRNFDQPEE